jgi:hypothetical protein
MTKSFDPIVPNKTCDRKSYCKSGTSQLYGYLEQTVRDFPTQWEAWLYVHNFLTQKKGL